MDEQKAIEIIEKQKFFLGQRAGRELWSNKPKEVQNEDIANFNGDMDYLLSVVREIQKYRALGSVEYLEELKERDTAKRPNYEGDGYKDGHLVLDTWVCPKCETNYEVDYDEYDFCPDCGQRIDWEEKRFEVVMTSDAFEDILDAYAIWDIMYDRYYADDCGKVLTYPTEEEAKIALEKICGQK